MPNKTQLYFINQGQFGHTAGYFYYCKHLIASNKYDITFVCYDQNLPKVALLGITFIYVPFAKNRYIRHLKWLLTIISLIHKSENSCLIFIKYFSFCFLLGLIFRNRRMILDIRTGSISPNKLVNKLQNIIFFLESLFFKRITILSQNLRKRLKLSPHKCSILPLGSDALSEKEKLFSSLRFLYVGTLNGRCIHKTILGLANFMQKHSITARYDIIGYGLQSELALLRNTIKETNLETSVTFHGRRSHSNLRSFFDNCNVGIAFVPMTPYYQCQPSTKIFEYVLSGMPCIATNTDENEQLINQSNGILCNDNPDSFAEALEQLYVKKDTYNSLTVKNSLKAYSWENIVNRILLPILDSLP